MHNTYSGADRESHPQNLIKADKRNAFVHMSFSKKQLNATVSECLKTPCIIVFKACHASVSQCTFVLLTRRRHFESSVTCTAMSPTGIVGFQRQ